MFGENLIRGKGLFVQSLMRAQASSLPFTPIFASLVAIINTKLPQIGELLLNRLIRQFLQSYKRNNKVNHLRFSTWLTLSQYTDKTTTECVVARCYRHGDFPRSTSESTSSP